MRRLHLFEIEDQSWCPRSLRDAETDYLRFAFSASNPYTTVVPRLIEAIKGTGATTVTDLCSGGGGPWKQILPTVRRDIPGLRVVLTDLYPNHDAFAAMRAEADVEFESRSVDATSPPRDLNGFRTLFTGFHHFRPDGARRILESAVASGQGIAIVEFTERRPLAVMLMVFLVPVITWLCVPFIRPFRWSRLFWTYPVPILPLLAAWDGAVSCMRSYTPAELRALVEGLDSYEWDIGTVPAPAGPGRVTWLFGAPAATAS